MTKILLAAFTVFLCVSPFSANDMTNQKQESGLPIPIRPLLPAPCPNCPRTSFISNSGLDKPVQVVIRNLRAWRNMWRRIHSRMTPVPPLPKVDFSREMIAVVAMGTRPTGAYGVVIERAFDRNGQLEIEVTNQAPGKNCFTTQAITQPVDIVRVPRTTRRVAFKETVIIQECK